MKMIAIMAIFFLIRRPMFFRRGLSALRDIRSSASRTAGLTASCAISDPWVNERVDDVDRDADDDERRGAEQRQRHDHVVVAPADRCEREAATPRHARQRLDEI